MRTRARIQAFAGALLRLARPSRAVGATVLAALAAGPLAAGSSDPVETALVIAFLILSLALHEVAHGWTALQFGDTTARDLGRLSLNPLVHIDLVWTIIVPLVTYMTSGFIFGGAKPVPVDYLRLRSPLRHMAVVAAAGPLTNLALGTLFLVAWKAAVYSGHYEDNQLLPRVLIASAHFNVLLFVFNLIPIPPLDGSRIMTWLLPAGMRTVYAGLEHVGMFLIVLLLFFVTSFRIFFLSGVRATIEFLDRITGGPW
jgi:Zn-dependent protease